MSYQVIARKYRPQIFDDVAGQPLVIGTLKNAILNDRVAHAYIFSGGRGVGKTSTARLLAKALNCIQGPTLTPCGQCDSCREITAGNSVDVLEIDAASNRGIDEIRELRESVRYLPARDRYKVFIIDEVHMLTTEAFNALLKTLEEPPPRSLFILATTEAHKLPATIQSRCQHFAFRLLDYSQIYERLEDVCRRENIQAEPGALSALARAAEGSLRDALSLLDEMIAACGSQVDEARVRQQLGVVPSSLLVALVESIRQGDSRAVLESVHQLCSEGYELAHFCGGFTQFIRDLMVARSCGTASPLLQAPDDEKSELARLAQLFSEEDLARFFQVLLRLQGEMRYSLQPRFHLELGLIKLVHARKLVAIESLISRMETTGAPAARPAGSGAPPAGRPPGGGPAPSSQGSRFGGPVRASAQGVSPANTSSAAPLRSGALAAPAAPDSLSARPVLVNARAAAPAETTAARNSANGATTSTQTSSEPVATPLGVAATAPAAESDSTEIARLQDATSARSEAANPALAPSTVQREQEQPSGLPEDARLGAIRALLSEQSKFLASCLNPLVGWRCEKGEVHFIYGKDGVWAVELLKAREQQEKLRQACERALGRPVKIYVTLSVEEGNGRAPSRLSAEERAQQNPTVENFRRIFDCAVIQVEDLSGE